MPYYNKFEFSNESYFIDLEKALFYAGTKVFVDSSDVNYVNHLSSKIQNPLRFSGYRIHRF